MERHTRADIYDFWYTQWTESGSASDKVLKAAPGAGKCLCITDIIICANAGTSIVLEEDGSSDVVLIDFVADVSGDNAIVSLQTPIQLTANEELQVTSNGTFTITVCGYTAKA